MSWRRLLSTILLLLLVVPGLNAQQPSGQTPPQSWRISGKVVDARSGADLARCSVQIDPVTGRGESHALVTSDDGQFTFDGLPQGKYRLSASKRGYLTQAFEEHGDYSTAIAVGPDLVSEGLIFKVTPRAILTGLITDDRGEPLRGAQVRLFEDQDRIGIRSTEMRQMAVTDDRGIYEISNIGPGNYYLAVSAQPWYARHPQRQNGEPEDESVSPLDVAYPTTFYPQVTDSEEATPIPIKGGERLEANVTLTAQQAMRLRIKLPTADPDHPGPYNVELSQPLFGEPQQLVSGMQRMENGDLEISGILPGHYDVALTHFEPRGGPSETTRFQADVAAGATELAAADNPSDVTVAGKVTSSDGKIPSGSIMFRSALHPGRVHPAVLNQTGEFSVNVPPGDYEVIGQISQMYLAHIASLDGEIKGHVLSVKAGESPNLQIIAGTGFGQIDGVARRGGQPASGVMVLLAPDDNVTLFYRDQSDSDGTFTLENIVPGHYHLLAVERGWELEWANRDVLKVFLQKSVPVEVRTNDKLTRTVEVQSR
jgi:Carboxypeptidase regulatory-like domain